MADTTYTPDRCKELKPLELLAALLLAAALLLMFDRGYATLERFEPDDDYRIELSLRGQDNWREAFTAKGRMIIDNYWVWQRWARLAARRNMIFVLGDSYIWGERCEAGGTLPAHLNRAAGRQSFANLGCDGMHPLAMEQLVKYYAPKLRGQHAILHYGFVWSSSPQHDWQTHDPYHQNPRLVPMFLPPLPGVSYTFAQRLGILKERVVPGDSLMTHMVTAALENTPLLDWLGKHPGQLPFNQAMLDIPSAPGKGKPVERSPYLHDWNYHASEAMGVPPDQSNQFQAFVRTVRYLRRAGCNVLIMVEPSNWKAVDEKGTIALRRHYGQRRDALRKRLEEAGADDAGRDQIDRELAEVEATLKRFAWSPRNASARALATRRKHVIERLRALDVPLVAPELASEYFADSMHPTADGYSRVADQLMQDPVFKEWFEKHPQGKPP